MDPFSPLTWASELINGINVVINQITGTISKIMNSMSFIQVIGIIVMIGKCVFAAFSFVIQFTMWIFDFLKWLIIPWPSGFLDPKKSDLGEEVGFFCWLIRYIIVIAYKITSLPKCFLWYFLDTAGWILYLPFGFVFWLLDYMLSIDTFETNEKKFWYFLDEIDYFLHGKPRDNWFMYQYRISDENVDSNGDPIGKDGNDPTALNLGIHIIHFPDSVMNQCYSLSPYSLAKLKSFPIDAFQAFMSCAMNPF